MNVTLTSLEALILKATHESLPHPDEAAVEAFCVITKDSADGPQLAAQALAARIHSQKGREAILALSMLERCMRKCDASFHAEIGKFRFLNELIKLVSPKYLAHKTSLQVQSRILQLLYAWSVQFPKESKFKVAYDMLKNQGVVKETPPPLPPEDAPPLRQKFKNAIFEDEEKSKLLQKLLQSKKPEDLQHANRLIKTMVREEERRSEANSRRAQEVSAALDSAGLLRDMLDRASDASPDEEQLIHELYSSCSRLRPVLQRLAAVDTQSDNLDDILHASDVLDDVFEKYNLFVSEKTSKSKRARERQSNKGDSLLDFAGAASCKNAGDKQKNAKIHKPNVIDELGDIFSTESSSNHIAEPLKPVSLTQNDDISLLGDKTGKTEGWNELDSLGEQLLKQSLPENAKRIDNFNSKQVKKIPMNSLEKCLPKTETQSTNNDALFDLDFFIKKSEEKTDSVEVPQSCKQQQANDDAMVDLSTNVTSSTVDRTISHAADGPLENIIDLGLPLENNTNREKETVKDNKKSKKISQHKGMIKNNKVGEVKPLNDINVTLQSVQPSKVPPLTVFEEEGGLTVVLHFCKDKPRPDVNVIVISTTSKNSSPIEDYKFQAVLPKGCKVRLLPASGSSLPAYNPFLPPPALTQVMLVGRAASLPRPPLRFVLSYTCHDESCSEMGEAGELPLDGI